MRLTTPPNGTAEVHNLPGSFWRVFSSGVLSVSAAEFYAVSLAWLVLEETGSPAVLGAVLAAVSIPRALLMPIGGAIADRHGPRTVLVLDATARTLLLPALALVFAAGALWALYPLAVLLGIAAALYYPAQASILPRLLPSSALQRGNGLVQGANQTASVVGPAIAGILVAAMGGLPVLYAAAVLYAVAAAVIFRLPATKSLEETGEDLGPRLLGGWRAVRADTALSWLLVVVAFVNIGFAGPFAVGLPTLVREAFGSAASAYGVLAACFAAGAAGGALAATRMGGEDRRRQLRLALGTATGTAAAIGGVGLAPSLPMVGVLLVIAGVCSGIANVVLITLIQIRAPKAVLGRVMSLVLFAAMGLVPLSEAGAGLLAEAVGANALFLIGGGISLLALALGAPMLLRR